MTVTQEILLRKLLESGFFLMKKMNGSGEPSYMLYSGRMVPERYFKIKVVEKAPIVFLLKKDQRNRYTLNLSKVRMIDGRNKVKKIYKKLKNKSRKVCNPCCYTSSFYHGQKVLAV